MRVSFTSAMGPSSERQKIGFLCIGTQSLNLLPSQLVRSSLLSCLHIAWSRVLEKLTGFQLVKKFPAFYGTRRFITAFTSVRHLHLS